MPFAYSKQEIIDAIIDTTRANELEAGYIRPICFYGYGKMGVNPVGNPVDFAIVCWPWGAYLPHEAVDVKVSSYIRFHPRSTVVDAKLSGHYINGVLASLELQGTHYHEALFLDDKGYISEGIGENFFMVKDGIIYTPKLGTILAGITRDTVIKLSKTLGFKVIEKDITLDEAFAADEAFFTGTAAEVTAIRSLEDRVLKEVPVGKITAQIKKTYLDVVHGKNPEFMKYLTFI
jgi:branched-chain amino acid aminotransferase